jgi:hypothetical protein
MNNNNLTILSLCVSFLALGLAIAALYTANNNSMDSLMKQSMKMMEKYDPSKFDPAKFGK